MTNSESTNGTQALVVRIASLLERLLHGEQPNPELFDCIEAATIFLASHSVSARPPGPASDSDLNAEELETLESLDRYPHAPSSRLYWRRRRLEWPRPFLGIK